MALTEAAEASSSGIRREAVGAAELGQEIILTRGPFLLDAIDGADSLYAGEKMLPFEA